MIIEDIENSFKHNFQQQIKILLGNTVLKQGRFVLIKPNAFSMDFYIKTQKTEIEIFQLPLPFRFKTESPKGFVFDYDVGNLLIKNSEIYNRIIEYARKNKTSKFLNANVLITFE
jgi:hypothetical protein